MAWQKAFANRPAEDEGSMDDASAGPLLRPVRGLCLRLSRRSRGLGASEGGWVSPTPPLRLASCLSLKTAKSHNIMKLHSLDNDSLAIVHWRQQVSCHLPVDELIKKSNDLPTGLTHRQFQ